MDTYDSNETLLAKLQAGATGYDIVVPSQNFVPIMINEGLIQKVGVHALPNFQKFGRSLEKTGMGSATGIHRALAMGHHVVLVQQRTVFR